MGTDVRRLGADARSRRSHTASAKTTRPPRRRSPPAPRVKRAADPAAHNLAAAAPAAAANVPTEFSPIGCLRQFDARQCVAAGARPDSHSRSRYQYVRSGQDDSSDPIHGEKHEAVFRHSCGSHRRRDGSRCHGHRSSLAGAGRHRPGVPSRLGQVHPPRVTEADLRSLTAGWNPPAGREARRVSKIGRQSAPMLAFAQASARSTAKSTANRKSASGASCQSASSSRANSPGLIRAVELIADSAPFGKALKTATAEGTPVTETDAFAHNPQNRATNGISYSI